MSSVNDSTSFRDLLRRITPWWLHGFIGLRLLYAIGTVLDAIGDMAVSAISLRFPLASTPDVLPLIGQERRIPRGRAEPAAIYAVRLRRWLDDHRTRGGPYAMLAQLAAFWAATPFRIRLYYALGTLFDMPVGGPVTRSLIGGFSPVWPQWLLVFDWPVAVHSDGIWSDPGTYDDGGVWDSDLSADDVADIRCVPTAWNAAHCSGTVLVESPLGGYIAPVNITQ